MRQSDEVSPVNEPTNPVATPESESGSSSYDLFILVLTVFSLVTMVLLLLPLSQATLDALRVYDNVFCAIFIVDFAMNLARSRPRSEYFITRRGWLDLLGSVPSFGFFPAAGLFRLARISRLSRVARVLRGSNRRALIHDIVSRRGEYALFITVLAALLVLSVSTLLMIQVESSSPDANITTGGDALWWAFVTITTVGYGDQYPVTTMGRFIGVFVMFAGVGIIGSLASILASVLVPQPAPAEADGTPQPSDAAVAVELANLRSELAALRRTLADRG